MNTHRPGMNEFFGFQHHPFADTDRHAKAFVSPQDARIRERLLSLLQYGKSVAVCGPCGVGKSTLTGHIIKSLDPNLYKPVLLHYAGFNRSAFLRAVAERFGVDTTGRSLPLLVRLQKHLQGLSAAGNSLFPVLLIDDAQLLERESLLDLCALMASAEKKTVAAAIVLIGDDTLRQRLALNVMAPVASRLTTIFRLDALEEKDAMAFMAFRLKQAKAPEHLFEPAAMEMIAAHCRGNRRHIVNCATLLLEEAYFRNEKTVSPQTLLECELIGPGSFKMD